MYDILSGATVPPGPVCLAPGRAGAWHYPCTEGRREIAAWADARWRGAVRVTADEGIVSVTNGRATTVLVVDDDPAMRALLRDWLERAGYRVLEEPTGERLLAAARTMRFDVVILDKEMPEPGGLEVLADFRQRCPRTPVILITAFGGSRVADEALRLGAYRYLEKPFQLGAILLAVQEAEQDPRSPGEGAGERAGSPSP